MSGRRRPRAQKRAGRAGKPRTLRTRLVVASVVLIAVICSVIGTVTTLALRTHLYDQLGDQVFDAGKRLAGPPFGRDNDPNSAALDQLDKFVSYGPTQEDTVVAKVGADGTISKAVIAKQVSDETRQQMNPTPLTKDQSAALADVSTTGKHAVTIPGLGDYLVMYVRGNDGADYYVALPTATVDSTVNTLILVEISVTAAGLGAAVIAGYVLVGLATRPLRRVANTATRVSELPLHTGEVNLSERVPEAECDPHTEVGQVGSALNRMLDHVHGALHARQQSEMRVRQFVADASHELRTPLASIRGYAELTRRGREEVGPDTRHALGRIESEAGRMTLLVEDLLLLARLDAGRPLQFEQTDLIPLVVDTISDARAAGMDHNWRLDLPDEPALVSGDAARLQQVLINLLGNARKHTPEGTTVTARIQRRGPWMCVDVEDNGQGIPSDLLPHVFERFARGDSSRSRASGSTGLGLAIVEAVATAHGGAVTVDSVPGRTVFTMHLPAIGPVAPRPAPETNWQSHSQAQHSAAIWVQQGA
ncbi:HAMP domain-containing sensor histidine kinase [Streptomyces sp. LUP47B]|uniref:sensor histidine kinase n=1 Tax=Streptomyces sp. LUP47B TaxID=1890286 RepID=UPI0009A00126|nr:HAMP domain-containing sensor histidine kinase [Streptomyces sp. LUP47B]